MIGQSTCPSVAREFHADAIFFAIIFVSYGKDL